MHETHRRAAELHELAAKAHRTQPSITKRGTMKREGGMRNER